MKLVMFGPKGQEVTGALDSENRIRNLSDMVPPLSGAFFEEKSLEKLKNLDLDALPLAPEGSRLGPCLTQVGKVICVGLNYSDHAAETNSRLPKEPILFFKATSAITGPTDPIEIPRGSTATDWEVELGVVMGKTAKYVMPEEALSYVGGYCTVNDVSERDFQLKRSGQWVKGKSHDTFAPIGPWLVTADEVPDPQNLALYCKVNGVRYQNGHTSNMAVGVADLVSYISHFMTLEPGDIIATGTPAGVGMGQDPQVFLKPGNTVKVEVEGLGAQLSPVVEAE